MKLTSRAARGIVITAAACAAVMAPAIALASTGSPARTAAPAPVSPCPTANLVIWLDTNGSGAAGSTYYKLHFTNLGPTCTMDGFPFLYAINLTGHQIGRRASFSKPPNPTMITLHSQKTATAMLRIGDAHFFSKALCGKLVTASGLKVFPMETQAKSIPFPFPMCTSTSIQVLFVGAVK